MFPAEPNPVPLGTLSTSAGPCPLDPATRPFITQRSTAAAFLRPDGRRAEAETPPAAFYRAWATILARMGAPYGTPTVHRPKKPRVLNWGSARLPRQSRANPRRRRAPAR